MIDLESIFPGLSCKIFKRKIPIWEICCHIIPTWSFRISQWKMDTVCSWQTQASKNRH